MPIHTQEQRLKIGSFIIVCLCIALLLRLVDLQIIHFKRYATLSLKNQLSIIPIAPPRGMIVDKNGVVLAENRPVHVLEIIPERVKNISQTLQQLQQLIPAISKEEIDNFKRAQKNNRPFVPIPLKLKLTEEEAAIFANNQFRFPGVNLNARLLRFYPLGAATAHILGYASRLNAQDLLAVEPTNYRATNFIGKTGVEKFYEERLHGKIGYQLVETNASGRVVRILNKQNPIAGAKIYLTIDTRLQNIAFAALQNKRGAAVVLKVDSGEILAMVSTPSFDPNIFVKGIYANDYKKLINAPAKPLFNRAVKGLYPPGSTIKPFVALAGLKAGVIAPEQRIYDRGTFKLPNVSQIYHDWKKNGHGFINLKKALTVSCDIYFYQLGQKLGISTLEDLLVQFGFGHLTNIDLNEEAAGIVPNKQWKLRTQGNAWYTGDTIITAIGQGFMLASPLQLVNATAALSQAGRRFRPHLLNKIENSAHQTIEQYQNIEEYPVLMHNENHWQIITESMQAVVYDKEGTGFRFGRPTNYVVAAKTGTAQVFGGSKYDKIRHGKMRYEEIPELLRDHSLFIAFAPLTKPEIAVAVIVENDFAAANIARKIMDAYFSLPYLREDLPPIPPILR